MPLIETATLAGAVLSAFRSLRFIKEGERGVLLRFGRFKRVLEPGFNFVIPFIDSVDRVHVRQNTVNMPDQRVMLLDKLTFVVSSILIYTVKDVYKALFEIDQIHDSIVNVSLATLRELLSQRKHEETQDFKKLNADLLEAIRKRTETWGIEIGSFELTDFEPTPETARILLAVEQVRRQIEGNDLLVEHLEKQVGRLKSLASLGPLATALVMRGIGGDQNAVVALPGSTSNMTKERPLRPGEVATEQAHEEEPE